MRVGRPGLYRRKLRMGFCKRVCGVLGDVAGVARGLEIDREWKPPVKREVALDAEAKSARDAFQFRKADAAEIGKPRPRSQRPNSVSPSGSS